jgi:hypothetical protein
VFAKPVLSLSKDSWLKRLFPKKSIEQGAQVISSDEKHIGNVEQVIADSESKTVTHFVIGKGFLLKEHKLVPASWVANVDEDKIYLSVKALLFERLPDYQPD